MLCVVFFLCWHPYRLLLQIHTIATECSLKFYSKHSTTSPTEGGSITGSLTLQNTNSQLAANVEYSFYANAISPSTRLLTSTVNIPADDFTTVSATWDGLAEGENKLWVSYSYNNGPTQEFYHSFTVQGLPSLYIAESTMTPSSGIHSGDTVGLSTKIANIGSVDAAASHLEIDSQVR